MKPSVEIKYYHTPQPKTPPMKININYIEGKGWEAEMIHGGIRLIKTSGYLPHILEWIQFNAESLRKKGNTISEVCQLIISKGECLTPEDLICILKRYDLYYASQS